MLLSVRQCSEHLLADLESCWESSILLKKICCVINHHCVANFSVYVRYCINQVRLDATLKRCRGDLNAGSPTVGSSPVSNKSKNKFFETLKKLEANPACQSLSLYSFLMLPMQRITRLPLLIDAVLNKLTPSDEEYEECQKCFRAINEVIILLFLFFMLPFLNIYIVLHTTVFIYYFYVASFLFDFFLDCDAL